MEWLYDPDYLGASGFDCYQDSILIMRGNHIKIEKQPLDVSGRKGAVGFVLANTAIVGGGESILDGLGTVGRPGPAGPDCLVQTDSRNGVRRICHIDFLEVDLKSYQTRKLDQLPGEARFRLVGFKLGERGFAGLGIACTHRLRQVQPLQDWYELDPTRPMGQQWSSREPIPTDDESACAFSIQDKG
ncbi:MAG: hypothetical protein HKN76_06095, partial [Saprospiraceae bacterium]|nr:hypothetical protein [Saprospiraceae bacterium]